MFKDTVKSVGGAVGGILVLALFVIVPLLLLKGGVWISAKIYPAVSVVCLLTLVVMIVVFTPMACFRSTRGVAALCLMWSSFILGFSLWIWSFLLTYVLWGMLGLILGLLIFGVGVFPFAMLATAFAGQWSTFGQLVLMAVLTYGSRAWSLSLAERVERDRYRNEAIDAEVIESN